ncbi:hypothetical protein A2cp1_4134 [Anaeromyxobacter dehalogenans 2CP-1]|uniref:Lipoprotein n=1 Tax=Anaeromyxobacter dehalogenans (strain ATCC BAA-258 / DSM 21875 / 2CP-1) TaxID=455488 RepID=B8J9R3_ANAD2|nr:hypothetical protein [Anaeromyxobacter dehalogenans]ACL67451.1 hypothetical protein A2cp1_4134 [Anaeromyxobacter dehalogenans 2CP-1]
MTKRAASIVALGIVAALAVPAASCERGTRRVVHRVADPSAQWVAVVDEVEYANGLLTSVADRVLVREAASKDAAGTIVFSEDALPDLEKPTVAWEAGRLVITASRSANVLRREARAHGFEVEVRPR